MHRSESNSVESPIRPSLVRLGNLTIDRNAKQVSFEGGRVDLTAAEFDLMWYLATNNDRVVTRDELFEQLLRLEYDGLNRTIDLRVSRLRRKLGNHGLPLIRSIRSEGYLFSVASSPKSTTSN